MLMPIRLVFALILVLTTPWLLLAEVQDETALDVEVREIAKTLRCTVCQTENIWESGAPSLILAMIGSGLPVRLGDLRILAPCYPQTQRKWGRGLFAKTEESGQRGRFPG